MRGWEEVDQHQRHALAQGVVGDLSWWCLSSETADPWGLSGSCQPVLPVRSPPTVQRPAQQVLVWEHLLILPMLSTPGPLGEI